jgi:hypothetical protein
VDGYLKPELGRKFDIRQTFLDTEARNFSSEVIHVEIPLREQRRLRSAPHVITIPFGFSRRPKYNITNGRVLALQGTALRIRGKCLEWSDFGAHQRCTLRNY